MQIVKDNVLQRGQATGHCHQVIGEAIVRSDGEGNATIDASKDVVIVHDEHNTLAIPAGKYVKRQVQEFDYDANMAIDAYD